MSIQIPLFDLPPTGKGDETSRALEAVHAEARGIASELPPEICFGTSSWSFPGWKGLVYSGALPAASLSREGLRENEVLFVARVVRSDVGEVAAGAIRLPAHRAIPVHSERRDEVHEREGEPQRVERLRRRVECSESPFAATEVAHR